MPVTIRAYTAADAEAAARIWNEVVEDGAAFPQTEPLAPAEADAFFSAQTYTAVAEDGDTRRILGLYILHPNNIGRCGHIANASYAVERACRGQGIGEALVRDCLRMGREKGFRVLQFNAVVAANTAARRLYARLGFHELGTVPGGFRMDGGVYEDIVLYWHEL